MVDFVQEVAMPPQLEGQDAVMIHLILPKRLAERFDDYRRAHDYGTRTEAIRDLIRRAIEADDAEPSVIRRERYARKRAAAPGEPQP